MARLDGNRSAKLQRPAKISISGMETKYYSEPCQEETCLQGFQSGSTHTRLYSMDGQDGLCFSPGFGHIELNKTVPSGFTLFYNQPFC